MSYSDPESGVTVATDWADASGATVAVSFEAPPCIADHPHVAVSPVESQWVPPGTAVTYTITVTSQDSLGCGPGTFDLLATVPAGWTAAFAEPSLALDPGLSVSTSLAVTSPASAADGFYGIVATAENSVEPSYVGEASMTYVVSAAVVNEPPLAAADGADTLENTPVTIDVLANDSDPDGDPLVVTGVTQAAKGALGVNADGTVTYSPAKGAKGRDSFEYVVSDGINTATAPVTVKIMDG